jgi:hypothetical protein
MLHGELVEIADTQTRNKELPHAPRNMLPHGVGLARPLIEVANDAHPLGIWRPDGKVDPFDTIDLAELSPHSGIGIPMSTLS